MTKQSTIRFREMIDFLVSIRGSYGEELRWKIIPFRRLIVHFEQAPQTHHTTPPCSTSPSPTPIINTHWSMGPSVCSELQKKPSHSSVLVACQRAVLAACPMTLVESFGRLVSRPNGQPRANSMRISVEVRAQTC